MRNKSYYLLFVLYILMFGFILFINGVFTGQVTSRSNLVINIAFLILIGILMVIAAVHFTRLNQVTDALLDTADVMQKAYDDGKKNLWNEYKDKKDVFGNDLLDWQFAKYQRRIAAHTTAKGSVVSACPVEDYLNEDFMDQISCAHFNGAVSGTMSGLGILGTFLGLTLGMIHFTGNDIFTISDNIGPLLDGMKVAFHTSVYGIFFSLVFNFVYRGLMADAYEKLSVFLETFHECAEPSVSTVDENTSAMLIYQANMANSMKTIMELMKGQAAEQTKGLSQIVQQFVNQMSETMGSDMEQLGTNLKEACEAQATYARNFQRLEESTKLLLEASRSMHDTVNVSLERQEEMAEKLSETCDNISNELYTFHQMRDLYEK